MWALLPRGLLLPLLVSVADLRTPPVCPPTETSRRHILPANDSRYKNAIIHSRRQAANEEGRNEKVPHHQLQPFAEHGFPGVSSDTSL